MTWTPEPIHCEVQAAYCDSTLENRDRDHHEADKTNKKQKSVVVEGKKRILHAPRTDVLQSAEPGEEAREMARIAPDPEAVARGIPRMEKDQPSWQSTRGGVELPEGSSGESPARWAATDEEVSSAVRVLGRVLELAGRVQKYPTRVLLDSGSTGNFISTQFVAAAGLTIQPDSDWEEVTLADGSKLRTEGRVQFTLRCGKYKERVLARVFPDLHKEIILGIPWLEKANPMID